MSQSESSQSGAADAGKGDAGSGRVRPRWSGLERLYEQLGQQAPTQPKLLSNALGMKFVLIPAGTLLMGSPAEEPERRPNEGPLHEVLFPEPWYLGVCPVTQEHYETVMGQNPSYFLLPAGRSAQHPVENVSWEDAVLFCERLSQMAAESAARRTYRLPTEAEWEHACRAGARTPFGYGKTLSALQANFASEYPYGGELPQPSAGQTTPVGSRQANNFGLLDMHGNVWEWCADWFSEGYYGRSAARNPPGPEAGQFRVLRGGCWRSHAATCRAAYRNALVPNNRDRYSGFRIVCVTSPA